MNIWKRETIYSKRYPRPSSQQLLAELEAANREGPPPPKGLLKRALAQVEEEGSRPEDPEKMRQCRWITQLAMVASQRYEIDAHVTKGNGRVNVNLGLLYSDYCNECKVLLMEMASLSDGFSLVPDPSTDSGVILTFTYYTFQTT